MAGKENEMGSSRGESKIQFITIRNRGECVRTENIRTVASFMSP